MCDNIFLVITECESGSYGAGCASTCGHCADGVTTCDHLTGHCPESDCMAGWQGDKCGEQTNRSICYHEINNLIIIQYFWNCIYNQFCSHDCLVFSSI